MVFAFFPGTSSAQSALTQLSTNILTEELRDAALSGTIDSTAVLGRIQSEGEQQALDFLASRGISPTQIGDPSVQSLLRGAGIDPQFVSNPAGAATAQLTSFLQQQSASIPAIAALGLDVTNPLGALDELGRDLFDNVTAAAGIGGLGDLVGGLDLEGLVNIDDLLGEGLTNIDDLLGGLDTAGIGNLQDMLNDLPGIGGLSDLLGGLSTGGVGDLSDLLNSVPELGDLIPNLDLQGLGNFTELLNAGLPNLDDLLGGLGLEGIQNLSGLLNLDIPNLGDIIAGLGLGDITDLQNILNDAIPNISALLATLSIPGILDIGDLLGLDIGSIPNLDDLLGGLGLDGIANLQDLLDGVPGFEDLLGGLDLGGIGNLQDLLGLDIGGLQDILGDLSLDGIGNLGDLLNGVTDLGGLLDGLDIGGLENLTDILNIANLDVAGLMDGILGGLSAAGLDQFQDLLNSIGGIEDLLGGLDSVGIDQLTDLLNLDIAQLETLLANLDTLGLQNLTALLNLAGALDGILGELLAGLDLAGILNLAALLNLTDLTDLIGAITDLADLQTLIDILNGGGTIDEIIDQILDEFGIDLANPQNCDHCGYCSILDTVITELEQQQHKETKEKHSPTEFEEHRIWMVQDLWIGNILPAMMMMTEQFTATAMQQVMMIGTLLDAKTQLETQALIQQLHAQAHKDYHPSEGVCEVGTNIRSLAASERRSDFSQIVLSQRTLDRQLGVANTNAAEGRKEDLEGRREQFVQLYCNPRDFNNALSDICPNGGGPLANKDIDFMRTVGHAKTLGVDFLDNAGGASEDETDIFALASNLYSHEIFTRPSASQMGDAATLKPIHSLYLDARSIIAKRSVAENSFNAIVALKAEGSAQDSDDGGSRDYMRALLEQLAIPPDQIATLIGESPSYYAQMDVLARKIYQNPDFYINLYDKPANVARKRVALRAIQLMQDRDIFQSQLRTEAMLSVLFELSVIEEQGAVKGEVNQLTAVGTE